MVSKVKLKVFDANLLYLIGALLFVSVGAYVQRMDLKLGLIITEYILILLPPLIYLKVKKISIKDTLRLNKIRFKHITLIVLITICIYPTALVGNAILMFLLSLLGNLNIPELPTAKNIEQYITLLFVISISAGICEEVFFRGFILRGYESLGKKKAIIFSAILFGIFHFNVYNLMGPIVLGLVFGYLVYLTDSIFAGIVGHIVNNGLAVTLGFISNYLLSKLQTAQDTVPEMPMTVMLLYYIVIFGILAVAFGYLAYFLVGIIKKDIIEGPVENSIHEYSNAMEENELKLQWWELIPLYFVIPIILWVLYIQIGEIIKLG